MAIWYQLKKDKEINEADFINKLDASFWTQGDNKHIYETIQKNDKTGKNHFKEDDNFKLCSYFSFFETMYYFIERGILTIDLVNNVFHHRFFTGMHNKFAQDNEIIKDAEYYPRLFELYKKWYNFKKSRGEEIPNDKNNIIGFLKDFESKKMKKGK